MNEDAAPLVRGSRRGLFRSVRSRLILYCCTAFASVLIVIQLADIRGIPLTGRVGQMEEQKREVARNLGLVADLKKERILRTRKERFDGIRVLAQDPMIARNVVLLRARVMQLDAEHLPPAEARSRLRAEQGYRILSEHLANIARVYGIFPSLCIIDARTGRPLAATDETLLAADMSREPFFTSALESDSPFIGDVQVNPRRGRPTLYLSQAIADIDPETLAKKTGNAAVLAMELSADDIISPILQTGEGLGSTGEAILVDQDGRIITSLKHPLPDGTRAEPLKYRNTAQPAQLAATGHDGIIEAADYRGVPVLAAYRFVPVTNRWGWGLVVKRDLAELYAPIQADVRWAVGISVAGMGLLVALTVGIANRVTGPIRALSRAASRVAAGDFAARAAVSRSDEVGALAETFNDMIGRIERGHEQLEQKVSARTAELNETAERLQAVVAERTRMEEEVRRAREFLDKVINAVTDPVSVKDEAHCLVLVNDAFCRLLGRTREGLLGRTDRDFVPQEEADGNWEQDELVLATGIESEHEETIADQAGAVHHLLTKRTPFQDASGHRGVVGIIRDITERTQAGAALKESESRYRSLFLTMNEGMALHEVVPNDAGKPRDYVLLDVNPSFERITGIARDRCVGRTGSEVYGTPEAPYLDVFARVAQTGRPETFTTRFAPMNKDFRVSVYSPGPGRFATVFDDVTERNRAEEERERLNQMLAEKNTELEDVIYATSHDLRSPLVNIQGFSQELARVAEAMSSMLGRADIAGGLREELKRLLEKDIPDALNHIRSGTAKMDSLLSGLLRISRLGRAALRIEPLDMNVLMAEIVRSMEFQIKDAGVKVRIGDLPPCLGDAGQINQVFSNLLDNAIKYLDPGRPGEIDISAHVEGSGQVVYCVNDNGIGVPSSHRERIFELFHRLSAKGVAGEGLGLAIARRIVRRHNGSIWLDPDVREGTRVLVSLPGDVSQGKKP